MIELRSANSDDFNFLYQLKKKALKEYISNTWGWDEEWQKKYFIQNFKPNKIQIIVKSGKNIGCISILEEELCYFLSLIELFPEYQNKGIGTQLIEELILKANERNKCIKLHVLKVNNKAQRLYKRLGFLIEGESETHFKMIYKNQLSS
jgi:ribosomal protein S18 acetylase RimI-like enzyme